jgi:hypothetical protein
VCVSVCGVSVCFFVCAVCGVSVCVCVAPRRTFFNPLIDSRFSKAFSLYNLLIFPYHYELLYRLCAIK